MHVVWCMYPDCCLTQTVRYWCCGVGALDCHVVHRHGQISIVSWYVDLHSNPFGRTTVYDYDLMILDDGAVCRPFEVAGPKQMSARGVGR